MKGFVLAVVLPLAALSPRTLAQQVNVEFDQTVDFARYHTFAIRNGELRAKSPLLNSDLTKQKIEADIESRLMAKGLERSNGPADLNVRYSLGQANRREVEAYPAGWRGLGTRRVAYRVTEGTLVIDLRDPKTRSLVWRSVATSEKDKPSDIANKLDDMVRKSIDRYPPKK